MASTSTTNAATASRTTSDDDERGTFFFGFDAARTLVALGRGLSSDGIGPAADTAGPRRARGPAQASGRP